MSYQDTRWGSLTPPENQSMYSTVPGDLADIIGNDFDPQSRLYVHFWTNTPRKSINPFIPSSYELNELLFIYKSDFGIK